MVGLGWWGRHLVKSVAGSDRIEIVRLTSRSPHGHQAFSDEMDIPLADSYRHVLEDPDVDVLASRVERAATLIEVCRRRITNAGIQVERVVAAPESDTET